MNVKGFFCNHYRVSVTTTGCQSCNNVHACDQSEMGWLHYKKINKMIVDGFKIRFGILPKDKLLELLYAYESYVTNFLLDRRSGRDPLDVSQFIRCNELGFTKQEQKDDRQETETCTVI